MPRGSGSKGRSPFSHVKSRQHKARQLQPLKDIVSRELGTPYPVQDLPDKVPIVLTLAAGANPTAPSLWEKTVAAVYRIRSLHLSRTEEQYLTPHLVEGVYIYYHTPLPLNLASNKPQQASTSPFRFGHCTFPTPRA